MNFKQLKEQGNLDGLEISNYLPLAEKEMIIDGYEDLNGLIDEVCENGRLNRFKYEIHFCFAVLRVYTNVEFTDEKFTVDDYDFLMSSGLYKQIISKIGNDYYIFKTLLDDRIEDETSINGIIRNGISSLLAKIPDEQNIKEIMGQLQNVDPAKMDLLKQVLDFNNPSKVKGKSKKVK